MYKYSGCKITPSLSFVTMRAEEKMEKARVGKIANSLSVYSASGNTLFPF
jgi:hypothetical protein